MYEIQSISAFRKKYRKFIERNKKLEKAILLTIEQLKVNPKYKALKTHKIFHSNYGEVYSSYVTGDVRIIWMQIENKLIILLLDIGGHSSGKSVYR